MDANRAINLRPGEFIVVEALESLRLTVCSPGQPEPHAMLGGAAVVDRAPSFTPATLVQPTDASPSAEAPRPPDPGPERPAWTLEPGLPQVRWLREYGRRGLDDMIYAQQGLIRRNEELKALNRESILWNDGFDPDLDECGNNKTVYDLD